MQDLYPDIFRFTVSLFPSEDDDVVTSPYNAMLALNELVEHASAVLPIENQALMDIVAMVDSRVERSKVRASGENAQNLLGQGAYLLACNAAAALLPSAAWHCTALPVNPPTTSGESGWPDVIHIVRCREKAV